MTLRGSIVAIWALRVSLYAILAFITLLEVHRIHGFFADDAFITFRYARNLALGRGWVYNLGHPSSGATSPLYVVVLAVMYLVHPAMRDNATLIFSVGACIGSILTMESLWYMRLYVAGSVAALFLVANPWFALMRGMESGLFVLFAACAVYCYVRDWQWPSGLALALLTLTRGEGALLAVGCGVMWMATHRKFPTEMVVAGLVPLLIWAVYAFLTLHHILPDTLTAKVDQGASGYWGRGLIFFKGFVSLPKIQSDRAWAVSLLAAVIVGCGAFVVDRRSARIVLPLSWFALGFLFMYGVVWNVPAYHWYYVTPLYVAVILASVGVEHIMDLAWRQRNGVLLSLAVVLVGSVVGAGIAQTRNHFIYGPYIAAATWLRQHTAPTATVAATEIGVIGWVSHRTMVDYLGLLSPRTGQALREHDLTSWLLWYEPNYWVVHSPPWVFEEASTQPWFSSAFTKVYEARGIVIYRRYAPVSNAIATYDRARTLFVGRVSACVPSMRGKMAAAVNTLVRLYGMRPDLQKAFGKGGRLQLADLFDWAAGPGISVDAQKATLLPYASYYRSLARLHLTNACSVIPYPTALRGG